MDQAAAFDAGLTDTLRRIGVHASNRSWSGDFTLRVFMAGVAAVQILQPGTKVANFPPPHVDGTAV